MTTHCNYRTETGPEPGAPVHLRCIVHAQPHPCPQDADAPAPAKPRGRREHIRREVPPWRALVPDAVEYTECGKPVTSSDALTLAGLMDRIHVLGRVEAQAGVCRTCLSRVGYSPRWHRDPGGVIARDAESAYAEQATIELRALAALAQAHPDQFADLVAGLRGSPRLDDRREQRRRESQPPTRVYT